MGCDSRLLRHKYGDHNALDRDHSPSVSARRLAVRKRHDGRGVVVDRAVHAQGELRSAGRVRTALRAVVERHPLLATTGCQWRQLPKDFPPYSTVQGYFYRWAQDGTLARINHALVVASRERQGREASPTAGVIDSQSVKTTEAAVPGATTPARRSPVASATSSPTRKAISSVSRCIPPTFRTATARLVSSPRSAGSIRGCAICSPTAATPETSFATPWPNSADGRSRSSSAPTPRRASRSCPSLGRRTHLRLARSLPSPCQGLRGDHRQRRRMGLRRPYPHALQMPRKSLKP